MEVHSRKILGVLVLFISSSIEQFIQDRGNKWIFESFRQCLLNRGFNHSNIVPRSGSKKYNDLNYQWQLELPQIYPLAYVLPNEENDVVSAVSCGQKSKIKLVSKSGGHSFEKYSYGDEDTVVLDLRLMNQVVKLSRTTALIGPAALLGPIYYQLWKSGKVFIPAGSCPSVGISGFSTGGGFGFFSRKYGLSSDYILEMNVVTSEKGLITVNNSTNSDLYWALRGGGGGSFGVITKFIFRVTPAPRKIFVGVLTYKPEQCQEAFTAWEKLVAKASRNIAAKFIITNKEMELNFFDVSGSTSEFQRMRKIFPINSTASNAKTYRYKNFLVLQSTSFALPLRAGILLESPKDLKNLRTDSQGPVYLVEKSFFAQRNLEANQVTQLCSFFKNQADGLNVGLSTWGGAINDIEESETAFIHRRGRLYLVTSSSTSNFFSKDARGVKTFFEFAKVIYNHKESFQNYADHQLVEYLQRYYGQNRFRLSQVKRKYDPTNYFKFPQSIPLFL